VSLLTFTVASSSICLFLEIASMLWNFLVRKGKGILSPHIDTRTWLPKVFFVHVPPKIGEDEPIFQCVRDVKPSKKDLNSKQCALVKNPRQTGWRCREHDLWRQPGGLGQAVEWESKPCHISHKKKCLVVLERDYSTLGRILLIFPYAPLWHDGNPSI